MGPGGTDSQDQSTDTDETILGRIERDHRQIVNFYFRELATAQEPIRTRELLDPLSEMLSKHFADARYPEEGELGMTPLDAAKISGRGTAHKHRYRFAWRDPSAAGPAPCARRHARP